MARHLPGLQGRHLSRRSSCTRSWPTWPASASRPAITRAFIGERPIKAVLDPYNPTGSTMPRQLHHLEDRPLADRPAPLPRQLGRPRQRLGGRVLPRRRGAPARARLRQEPQPRASRCRTATARRRARTCPTSSCWSTTATATTTCCTWSSRSRATAARTPRRRRRRWRPTGCPGVNNLGTLRPLGLRRAHRGLPDRGRLRRPKVESASSTTMIEGVNAHASRGLTRRRARARSQARLGSVSEVAIAPSRRRVDVST